MNEDPRPLSPSELFDLSGRVAIVTGGSRGLGRSIALGLAQAGADVVVTSRKLDACVRVAHEVEALGRRALAHAAHMGRWEDADALVEAAYAHFGRVDVLVNNAGMSPRYPDPQSVSEELYDKVLAVNLKGPFRLTALVGARMAAGEGGSIVNISSIGGARPTRHVIPYSAAKAGLNAMTVGFADAFGPSVRVNAIMPGSFMTDVSAAWDAEQFALRAQQFPLRRGGQPDELVGAALYFASDASSYATGSVLAVDGGAMWAQISSEA
jgi:NAD(P)-dependent dehydrogenase (short-subunit alcohol dehydrogenase family)